jgi:membrane protease YdiL (CAAX protease family)
LAEAAFFRGVLLPELRTNMGTTWATVVSAFAFSLLHLPQWLILDRLFGVELLSLFGTIFTYGVIFALLVNLTRSLWAALLPHWINNFILQALDN